MVFHYVDLMEKNKLNSITWFWKSCVIKKKLKTDNTDLTLADIVIVTALAPQKETNVNFYSFISFEIF